MLKVIRECAPWLSWKIGVALAAVVLLAVLAFGERAGLFALMRGKGARQAPETGTHSAVVASTCNCGSDVCTIGDGPDACRSETTAS